MNFSDILRSRNRSYQIFHIFYDHLYFRYSGNLEARWLSDIDGLLQLSVEERRFHIHVVAHQTGHVFHNFSLLVTNISSKSTSLLLDVEDGLLQLSVEERRFHVHVVAHKTGHMFRAIPCQGCCPRSFDEGGHYSFSLEPARHLDRVINNGLAVSTIV